MASKTKIEKPLSAKKLDAVINGFYLLHGDCVQVDIMDLGKIFKAAVVAYDTEFKSRVAAGEPASNTAIEACELALKLAIQTYRKN